MSEVNFVNTRRIFKCIFNLYLTALNVIQKNAINTLIAGYSMNVVLEACPPNIPNYESNVSGN